MWKKKKQKLLDNNSLTGYVTAGVLGSSHIIKISLSKISIVWKLRLQLQIL